MKTYSILLAAGIAAFSTVSAQAFTVNTYGFSVSGQFSIVDGNAYYGNFGNYSVYNLATGQTSSLGTPAGFVSGGDGAFTVYDKQTGTLYAGSYNYNTNKGYVYQNINGTWDASKNQQMENVMSAAAYNGILYIAGLPESWSGGTGQNTAIFRLNADGSTDTLINTSGNSSQIAVAGNGDIYYATYNYGSDGTLYRWSADTIANWDGGDALTHADADLAIAINGGSGGLTVDDAGNIFFIANSGSYGSYIGLVDLEAEDFSIFLSEADLTDLYPGLYWPMFLDAEGDVLNGGELFLSPSYGDNVIGIQVPEPATIALLMGAGALALTGVLRRRSRRQHA